MQIMPSNATRILQIDAQLFGANKKRKKNQKLKLWAKWDLVATAVDREMQ